MDKKTTTDEPPGVQREFCAVCGSSLLWAPKGMQPISVAADSMDNPLDLKTIGPIWLSRKADYYTLENELPGFPERWES